MKILYLTSAYQHPSMRASLRTYYFSRELSHSNEIILLSIAREPVTAEAENDLTDTTSYSHIEQVQETTLSATLKRIPVIGKRLKKYVEYKQAARRLEKEFKKVTAENEIDVVLFHGKLIASMIKGFNELPVVVDFCDATSMRTKARMDGEKIWMLPGLWYRYLQVRIQEKIILKASRQIAFISNRDREAILGSDSHGKIVSNGVDYDFWKRSSQPADQNTVVFVGIMDYAPNADTAMFLIDKILPIVRKTLPDFKVIIVGRSPLPDLVARGEVDPGVTVTGFVDDVRPYMEKATISVVPMRFASGVQNKVLEAMAMELPIITTGIVEESLRVEKNIAPVEVADRAEDFAKCIVQLLANVQKRKEMATEGRKYVEEHFDWTQNAKKLEKMCLEASTSS